jgi:tRNA G18 (ribose-2'-O)-methylase SpoU
VHRDVAVGVARPFCFRSIPGQLDAVAIRIGQVDRLADAVIGDTLQGDARINNASHRSCEVRARRVADCKVIEAGMVRWSGRSTPALPCVEADVVVITTSRQERRVMVQTHDLIESEHAAVKADRAIDVGDLQVDVTDDGCCGNVVVLHGTLKMTRMSWYDNSPRTAMAEDMTMKIVRIDRFDDPRIQEYRNVSDAEFLRTRNLFVAEGRLVVARLLAERHRMVSLLLNESSLHALETVLAAAREETPIYVCDTSDFASITGFNLHRGCLALAERPAARRADEIADRSELVLVLEAVTDADNVGSAFRNAAAFGVGGILLSPTCCDPLYRKAIRTSMGGALRVPYARCANWPGDLEILKARGFRLMALTPKESAVDLVSYMRQAGQKMAVLVGSEGPGLTEAVEAMADVHVRIPICSAVDSLNLATATGIALYFLRAAVRALRAD